MNKADEAPLVAGRQVGETLDKIDPLHVKRYFMASSFMPTSGTILDLGCGCGYGSYLLANEHPLRNVTGIDYSEEAVEYAREHYSLCNNSFAVMDLQLDTDNKYLADGIIATEVLEHIPDWAAFMNNVIKWLVPGGVLFVAVPFRDDTAGRNQYHVKDWPFDELAEVLISSGLTIEHSIGNFYYASKIMVARKPGVQI